MARTFTTSSVRETRSLALDLAERVLEKGPGKKARVFGLVGEFGSGKTAFVQGFARGLHLSVNITSPTYVIRKRFSVPGEGFEDFYHFDCYRLKRPEQLSGLGFGDICRKAGNIVVLEWAERVGKVLPDRTRLIRFGHQGKEERKIVFSF